ncbi:PfkB family carbohydrate kinase [Streptomyces sp. RPT161]|uniref:PfkB family carbohydrate kinase n=1 Tax=Streptomyces sp. RPT161 TaxID=3015993 RepID=UPI0022B8733B|nr:PfkB family carbohydrate kinase [Streptomyces sp. RPT161]
MRKRPLVVVGDALLDRDIDGQATRLAPDAPAPVVEVHGVRTRPGGAGLAAALAARDGREVILVTALGQGEADDTVRSLLADRVRIVDFPLNGTIPVKSRVRAGNRPLARLDDGGGTPGEPTEPVRRAIAEAGAVLVSDYGRGTACALRSQLAEAAQRVPVVWDPHPRGGAPVPGVRLATPNATEARALTEHMVAADGNPLRQYAARADALCDHWHAAAVVITLGERGALLSRGSASPMLLPARRQAAGDPCGAGDCFAATAASALADGGLIEEAVQCAVTAATDFVAHGGVGNPALWSAPSTTRAEPVPQSADPFALARSVRASGGTVVAAGGCFDLLHVGHVGLLESARRAGDCLIVCMNGDASVTRLKGPGRPLVPAADRARVLSALACVDAVAVFDEDVPVELLRKLRPDVWVKGGDYTAEALPEADVLRSWGGQALVLPYIDGRSTTELALRAAAAAVRTE